MKKLSSIILALAALSFAAVSCQEEEIFQPGEPDVTGCFGVYFPKQDASGSHTYDPTAEKSITIEVARTNSTGAITVPVKVTQNPDVFSFSEVSFADGQTTTELVVRFDNIQVGVESSFTVAVEDPQYASKYNDNAISIDCSILCVEWVNVLNPKTNEPAVVTFTSDWRGLERKAAMKYYEVDGVRTVVVSCIEEDGFGLFGGYPADLSFTWFPSKTGAWDNGDDDSLQAIDVAQSYFGFDYNNGDWNDVPEVEAPTPIYIFDWYSYFFTTGQYSKTADNFYKGNNANYPRSYYDGNGGFFINAQYYIIGLGGWTGKLYDIKLIVDGYTRTDYSLEAESDFSSDGILPLDFKAGKDVASIKYAFYPGSLSATQIDNKVAAISKGVDEATEIIPAEEDFYEGFYYFFEDVTLPETGAYTMVAVSFDKDGNAQDSASLEAYYVAAADVEDNEVNVSVAAENTPARYDGYQPYNSFAYYICGKDLTDVHLAILDASTLTQDVLDEIKFDEDGKYAVSDEVLAKINGAGGYYTVVSGVKASTRYAVLVWATNGSLDTFAVAYYQTANLPYVWNSLGKGIYVDDIVAPMYGMPAGMTAPCDVFEEKTHPGLYKISGFQLPFVAEIFETTEEEMALYEGGNWENAEIIIDAQNPNAVKIEEQFMGICLNSSDGWFYVTSMLNGAPFSNGTLANGEITFPVKGLLIALDDDGYYYGNKSGMFKVVLPSAAATAVVPSYPAGGHKYEVKFAGDFAKAKNTVFEREISAVSFSAAKGTPRLDSSSKKAEIKYGVEKLNF